MPGIILIEPENPGNVGATARAMANFGEKELVLINPKCDVKNKEALDRAKHGRHVLEKAVVGDSGLLDKFNILAGTTAKLGTDYNIPRTPITPEEFSKLADNRQKTGILFGRESRGLSNKEISRCDFIITIPSDRKYPTLNLSHSVAVILYELAKRKGSIKKRIAPMSGAEKNQVWKLFGKVLSKLEFATNEKKKTQEKVWKKILGKSFMSKRESYAVMGLFKKLILRL